MFVLHSLGSCGFARAPSVEEVAKTHFSSAVLHFSVGSKARINAVQVQSCEIC